VEGTLDILRGKVGRRMVRVVTGGRRLTGLGSLETNEESRNNIREERSRHNFVDSNFSKHVAWHFAPGLACLLAIHDYYTIAQKCLSMKSLSRAAAMKLQHAGRPFEHQANTPVSETKQPLFQKPRGTISSSSPQMLCCSSAYALNKSATWDRLVFSPSV
jgi:hypothetical protein